MDIFMKNKLTTLLIILLLILNFFTMGTIWFGHFNKPDKRSPAPGPDNSDNFMARELGLSEEQKQHLKQLREKHFLITRNMNDDMRDIKRKINEELFRDKTDTLKVNELLKGFGKQQEAFEREIFNHFLAIKALCLPEQQEKLKALMHKIFRIDKREMGGMRREPPPRLRKDRGDKRKPPRDRKPRRGDNPPPPPRED